MKYFIFIFLFTYNAHCQGLIKSQKQIVKEGIKSTILIRGYKNKKLVFQGAGFFISRDGTFVTNHHVLEDAIKSPSEYRVEFLTSDEKRLTQVEFASCSDKRKIDLCVLKARNLKLKKTFTFSRQRIGLGQKVVLIGHCEDPPWSAKSGKIIKTWSDIQQNLGKMKVTRNDGVQTIETNVFQCGGDSGGPLFSPINGRLVGMTTERHVVTKGSKELKKYMMSITAKEIEAYIKKNRNFKKLPFRLRSLNYQGTIPTDDKSRKEMLKKLLN
ncbi:MAG: trypsin-like peptidase domain-containing protein [Bacteriovoracaceae bacterium]|nr:trypsin-like peptidase domain-containing protein [Bacteriovoracaceae bacterium]